MWKQIFLVLFFITAMYFGGLSTQSESSLLQGFGFVVIIIAFGLLYVISKVMWRAMGFMTSFFIIGSIVIFILYCLGLLGEGKSVKTFISGKQTAEIQAASISSDDKSSAEITDFADLEAEMFGAPVQNDDETETLAETSAEYEYPADVTKDQSAPTDSEMSVTEPQNPAQPEKKVLPKQPMQPKRSPQPRRTVTQTDDSGGFFDKLKGLFGSNESKQTFDFNPMDYPYIEGDAHVITASVLRIGRYYVKMLGIDAPDPNQTCADKHGGSYHCGQRALTWLQNWIHNRQIRCYVVGQIVRNRTTGVCFTMDGQYDLAAVVTNAGWAVAWTQNTEVYAPYERQAAENRRGLWEGRFYKPWDWRKIQNRKVKITIQDNSGGGFFDFFKGWF